MFHIREDTIENFNNIADPFRSHLLGTVDEQFKRIV